jgi:hypothetical protein
LSRGRHSLQGEEAVVREHVSCPGTLEAMCSRALC